MIVSLVALPISLYITHSILLAIHADRLLMFLFWVNVPCVLVVQILSKLIDADKAKAK